MKKKEAVERLDDAIFWDRLQDMPPLEAEQECVLRRERITLENAMLQTERAKISPPIGTKQKEAFADMGLAMSENAAQLTRLNERIKHIRRLQDSVKWKDAIRTLYGDEAVEQCVIHMERQRFELIASGRLLAG